MVGRRDVKSCRTAHSSRKQDQKSSETLQEANRESLVSDQNKPKTKNTLSRESEVKLALIIQKLVNKAVPNLLSEKDKGGLKLKRLAACSLQLWDILFCTRSAWSVLLKLFGLTAPLQQKKSQETFNMHTLYTHTAGRFCKQSAAPGMSSVYWVQRSMLEL